MPNTQNLQAEMSRLRESLRLLRQAYAVLGVAYEIETFSEYGAAMQSLLQALHALIRQLEERMGAVANKIKELEHE